MEIERTGREGYFLRGGGRYALSLRRISSAGCGGGEKRGRGGKRRKRERARERAAGRGKKEEEGAGRRKGGGGRERERERGRERAVVRAGIPKFAFCYHFSFCFPSALVFSCGRDYAGRETTCFSSLTGAGVLHRRQIFGEGCRKSRFCLPNPAEIRRRRLT